jgi:hypothetical protein
LTSSIPAQQVGAKLQAIRIYAYGVARNRLTQAAKRLGVPALVVQDVGEANVLVTLRTYYRNREKTVIDAEQRGMPIYVARQYGCWAEQFSAIITSPSSNNARYDGRCRGCAGSRPGDAA